MPAMWTVSSSPSSTKKHGMGWLSRGFWQGLYKSRDVYDNRKEWREEEGENEDCCGA